MTRLHVCKTACHRDLVDGFFNSVVDQVHPDSRWSRLADSVDSSDCLKLDCRLNQRLADENVCCIDQSQARRVRPGIEKETVNTGIVPKLLNSAIPTEPAVANSELV